MSAPNPTSSLTTTPYRFTGKRVLVTGAGKGIGRETARLLHACGAHVIALSRCLEDLETLREELVERCELLAVDLGDLQRTLELVQQRALPVDLLVNNAGVAHLQPFLETTLDAYQTTMDVNVRAQLFVAQLVARDLLRRGPDACHGAAIVNVSSQASAVAIADHSAYCASKAALDALTRCMALELGPHGIRVNSINPTVVLTPMAAAHWMKPEYHDPMIEKIPLRRFANPIDIARSIAYLLSDHAAMVHGTSLMVDGGYTIQ